MIAATVTLNEAYDFPKEVNEIYQSRRDALCDGLHRIAAVALVVALSAAVVTAEEKTTT